jgi:hypothetical protein
VAWAECFALIFFDGATTYDALCRAMASPAVMAITKSSIPELAEPFHGVDLTNSPSFEDKAVLEFFESSGRNLLAAEAVAGVRHHVASVRPPE